MPRLKFRDIEPATAPSNDIDQWEKFAREFFESVLGGTVLVEPSRGPDGGIDLKFRFLENGVPVDKLVSCKHFAHSGRSVGISDEEDIDDRMRSWGCTVFVGFYSTIVSTGLRTKLERLRAERGNKFELYNNELIESHLLGSHAGFMVAKRYFPNSVQNLWPKVIALEPVYSSTDAVEHGEKWIVEQAFDGRQRVWASNVDAAVRLANELATSDMHSTLFLAAWRDAARAFPGFFQIPVQGMQGAMSVEDLPPDWDALPETLKASPRWALLAIWSFNDADRVRTLLKSMHRDASQQDTDLMSLTFLAQSISTDLRDILTRLFAYCPG